jgi:hypothetical protein
MKTQCKSILIFLSILSLGGIAACGGVVHTVLTFDSNVVGNWSPVDFNNDGVDDVSFNFYGIGTENSSSFVLEFAGNGNTQVIGLNGSAVPLHSGETISLLPVTGDWMDSGMQKYVWITLFNGDVVGVGAPESGDYMGVRFQIDGDWHLGWIRFGQLENPSSPLPLPSWPSVLEFGYETIAGAPIITPVPEPQTWQLMGMSFLATVASRRIIQKKQSAA